MPKYIDVDLLKKQIEMEHILPHDICKSFLIFLEYFPKSNVKHGHWVKTVGTMYCSECAKNKKARIRSATFISPAFCEDCGAKMDEDGSYEKT